MNESAKTFAEEQARLLREQLAGLYTNLNQVKDSSVAEAEAKKKELLEKIARNRDAINTQFGVDSKSAYVNKMMGTQNVNDLLTRMGLSSSGFGLGEYGKNEIAYGQNYNNLVLNKNTQLQDVTNQEIDTENAHNTLLAGINTNYLKAKGDTDQYINESAQKMYDSSYNKIIDEQRYQDSLKQQAINNYYKSLSISNSSPKNYTNQPMPYTVGATGTPTGNGQVKYTGTDGSTYTFAAGVNPWVGQYNSAVLTNGVFDPSKAFNGSNGGYQPNTYNGNNLSKTGVQVQTAWGNQQNVWKAGNTYVVWNGPANRYDVLTKAEKKQAGLK